MFNGTLQVFRPGGVANTAGTPNFLIDLSSSCYQASWTDLMQGGLEKAQFDLRMPYENTLDLVFANWVLFGCLGGYLATGASAGATSIVLGGLPNSQTSAFDDLIANDTFIITDGVNTELFTVASKSSAGGGNYNIGLGSVYANAQIATLATLTADAAAGATSCTVDSTTNLSNGQIVVIGGQKVTIGTISGLTVPFSPALNNTASQYTGISDAAQGATSFTLSSVAGIANGTVLTIDDGLGASQRNATGAYVDTVTVSSISGNKVTTGPLVNSHSNTAPVVFQMAPKLQNSYGLGAIATRLQYQGYLTQRIHSTQRPQQFSIEATGFFTRYSGLMANSDVQSIDGGEMMLADIASFAGALPGAIVRSANCTSPSGQPVNISSTDQTMSELMATILRQENGFSDVQQFAVWVDATRQVFHESIGTLPAYADKAKTTLQGNTSINATNFQVKSLSHLIVGRSITITTGSNVDTLIIASRNVATKTITTTAGATYAHNAGDTVQAIFTATPTYQLTLSDQGSSFGDTIGSLQTTDMDGTGLMNAAIVTGVANNTQVGGTNQFTTDLTSATAPGATTFQVANPSIFTAGNTFVVGGNASSTREQLTVATVGSNSISSTGGAVNAHNMGEPVQLSTQLAGNTAVGATTFNVAQQIFSAGQEVTITPAGSNSETLTISTATAVGSPGSFTTTTAAKKTHSASDQVYLSENGTGDSPRIIVEQSDSIGDFGFFEGTLTSEDIWDEATLAQWAAQQLAITAWPVLKSQVQLNTTQARMDGRDLVQISGFTDGSTLTQNVISAQFTAVPADQNVSGTLTMGILASTARRVIKEITKEHAHRHRYHLPGVPKHNKNMVVNGFGFTQTGANTFTIGSGTLEYKGEIYNLNAFNGTAPDGESQWGAQCDSPIGVTKIPKRNWNGRDVYATSVYSIDSAGSSPNLKSKFFGLSLWRIECKGGNITGYWPIYSSRGSGHGNFPSPFSAPVPTATAITATLTGDTDTSCDLEVDFTVTNIPTDDSTHHVKLWTRINGTSKWSHKATYKIPGLPQPATSASFTAMFNGLHNGTTIDVGLSFDGLNGEGSVGAIVSGYTVSPLLIGAGSMAAMPSAILTGGPTISSATATRTAKKGTLHEFSVTMTETDFGSWPTWLHTIIVMIRNNGSTDNTHEVHVRKGTVSFGGGSGSFTKLIHGALGQAHDIGIVYRDFAGQTSAPTWPSGVNNQTDPNGDFENTSTGTMLRSRHDASITNVIDANSNILNVSFTGCKVGQDGTVTGVSSSGSASVQVHSFAAGQKITISWRVKSATGMPTTRVALGNITNGYVLTQNATAIIILHVVAGTGTTVATVKTVAADNNWHSGQFTITCLGASSNMIEGSWDDATPQIIANDTSLDLTTGTWPVTLYDGNNGTTKFSDVDIDGARPHHSLMSAGTQAAVDSRGNGLAVQFTGTKYSVADDTVTGVANGNGNNAVQSRTYAAGERFTISGKCMAISGTPTLRMGISSGGNAAGYFIQMASASATIGKITAGTGANLKTVKLATEDFTYHSFAVTVTCLGASSNEIEASFDDAPPVIVANDTSFDLTTGSWSAWLFDSNNGTSKFSDLKIDGHRVHHTVMSGGVQAALDPSGNILNVEFAGTKVNSKGVITGWATSQIAQEQLPTLVAGDTIEIDLVLEVGATGGTIDVGIADAAPIANGYTLRCSTTGVHTLRKTVASTGTNVVTSATVAQDTKYHGFKVTIGVVGASSNTIEGSIGSDSIGPTPDAGIDLTSGGPWFVYIAPGATPASALIKQFRVSIQKNHYSRLHTSVQNTIDSTPNAGDGSNIHANKISVRHIKGDTSGGTDDLMDGTTKAWKYTRHNINVKTAILPDNGSGVAALDPYGSAIQPAQSHRGHFETAGALGGKNILYHPTFDRGSNDFTGWNGPNVISGAGTFNWQTDAFGGGRAFVGISGAAGQQSFSQTVGISSGFPMVMAGRIVVNNTSGSSGYFGEIVVKGVTTGTVYAQLLIQNRSSNGGAQGGEFLSEQFTPSGDSQLIVSLVAGNGSSGGSLTVEFHKLKLEYNNVPTPYTDDHATNRVNVTHDVNANFLNVLFASPVALNGNGAMQDFDPVNGTSTKLNYPLPPLGALLIYAAITEADTSEPITVMIGNTTNGYGLQWETNGNLNCYRFSSGTFTAATSTGFGGGTPALNTLVGSTVTRDSAMHLFRIAIDSGRFSGSGFSIEVEFDGIYVMGVAIDSSQPHGWSTAALQTIPITIRASNGNVAHFDAKPRDAYLAASVPYQNATPP